MRKVVLSFGLTSVLAISSAARADTTRLFLDGTLAEGGRLSGSLSGNNGFFNPEGVTVVDGGVAYVFQGSFFEGVNTNGGMTYQLYSFTYNPVNAVLLLAFPVPSLAGYSGGALCSTTLDCSPKFTSSFSINGSLPGDRFRDAQREYNPGAGKPRAAKHRSPGTGRGFAEDATR